MPPPYVVHVVFHGTNESYFLISVKPLHLIGLSLFHIKRRKTKNDTYCLSIIMHFRNFEVSTKKCFTLRFTSLTITTYFPTDINSL